MKPKLIVVGGDAKPSEIDLTLPSVIGRGRSVAVTLPHPLVSREHCEIYLAEGRLHVRDLGSLNGTYVGNERVEDVVLPAGSLLTVGTVTFRAVYEDPAAAVDEDDLSFSIADPESDDLTVGPDEPLNSRTTAMLAPGSPGEDEAESAESETDSDELNPSPSEEFICRENSRGTFHTICHSENTLIFETRRYGNFLKNVSFLSSNSLVLLFVKKVIFRN